MFQLVIGHHQVLQNPIRRRNAQMLALKNLLQPDDGLINPLVLELDIYSLAHHVCKM